jgi:hypothetical protein
VEFIIGRRFAPTRWLHPGYNNFLFLESGLTSSDFRITLLLSRSFQRGRLAIVTDAERDAVDGEAPLTNGAEADERSRVVLTPRGRRQAGGSYPAGDGVKKS